MFPIEASQVFNNFIKSSIADMDRWCLMAKDIMFNSASLTSSLCSCCILISSKGSKSSNEVVAALAIKCSSVVSCISSFVSFTSNVLYASTFRFFHLRFLHLEGSIKQIVLM
eukprot:Pompholyxophrys_sp_v1_NODE_66_length_2530_cov_5.513328.p4 type:complete len:112 gc:universal NODE_66_length_2530_cov_5.513328:1009-1344(+)